MKLLGVFLILAAGVGLGTSSIFAEKKHLRIMNAVCVSLDLMYRELEARALPLPELFRVLADSAEGQCGSFYDRLCAELSHLGKESFSNLWRRTATEMLTELRSDELAELSRLGDTLGRYSLERQLEAIRLCRDRLNSALVSRQQRYPERQRLTLGLSTAAAALLVIILI